MTTRAADEAPGLRRLRRPGDQSLGGGGYRWRVLEVVRRRVPLLGSGGSGVGPVKLGELRPPRGSDAGGCSILSRRS